MQAAHLEPGSDEGPTATSLAAELRAVATWLGLERIKVMRKGSLSTPLRRALGKG